MTLVKIGRLTLNLDQVRAIRDWDTLDGTGQPVAGLVRIEFGRDHIVEVTDGATELRAWLAAQSTTILAPNAPAP